MNPFISFQEFSYQSQDSFLLLYCGSSPPSKFIPRSLFYQIEDNADAFINNCKSLDINEEKTIICYDNGEMQSACKAY